MEIFQTTEISPLEQAPIRGRPPAEELEQRRARLFERLPEEALALVRGARPGPAMRRFRQSNDFYYLTGVEVPGCFVLLDATDRGVTVYLPHRDEIRERSGGSVLTAEDVEQVRERTGASRVAGPERLPADLGRLSTRARRSIYVPHAPEEGEATARDSALDATAWAAVDPFVSAQPHESALAEGLRRWFPILEVRDLSPMLDELRLRKSEYELTLLREAARLCGLGVMEAMRSTGPGIHEYELEAVAQFVFRRGGARGFAYEPIVAGGQNAWFGHYNANDASLVAGDLVLMDCAPDVGYYTSDIGRMWPVDGRFTTSQRELYGWIVDYHHELLGRIGPGVAVTDILAGAADAMRRRLDLIQSSKPHYRTAMDASLEFRGHLSHPVGMAVHDVGSYRDRALEPGTVFSLDPMMWVPEEKLYVRVEDTIAVTADGVENLTGFVPIEINDVESLLDEPGLLQMWGPP